MRSPQPKGVNLTPTDLVDPELREECWQMSAAKRAALAAKLMKWARELEASAVRKARWSDYGNPWN